MLPVLHLRLSLGTAALFAALGLALEAVYGFRWAGFLDDPLRREFLRLGHAHGALLSFANIGLAWACDRLAVPERTARSLRMAGWCGAVLVGVGFLGGGWWHTATDPGPWVLLVPAGGLMFVAVLGTVSVTRTDPDRS